MKKRVSEPTSAINPETLLNQATPIPCGNTWNALDPTGDSARLCRDCDRSVHNLAALSPSELAKVISESGPQGRLCVVREPLESQRYSRLSGLFRLPMRYAALWFVMILMGQMLMGSAWAEAEKDPGLQETLRDCSTYLYTPMMWPPNTMCRDEHGKTTQSGEWTRRYYEEHQQKNGIQPLPVPVPGK